MTRMMHAPPAAIATTKTIDLKSYTTTIRATPGAAALDAAR